MRYRCCYDIFIIYYDISAAAARWPRAPTATRLLLVALQGLFTRVLIIVEIPRNPGPGFSSRRSRNSILVSHTKCVNFGIFPHSELWWHRILDKKLVSELGSEMVYHQSRVPAIFFSNQTHRLFIAYSSLIRGAYSWQIGVNLANHIGATKKSCLIYYFLNSYALVPMVTRGFTPICHQ